MFSSNLNSFLVDFSRWGGPKNALISPNLKEKEGEFFNTFDDKELRYRHRQLDIIANPEVMKVFKTRAKHCNFVRKPVCLPFLQLYSFS